MKENSSKVMRVAYSPVYVYELPEGHRFPMAKYELIPQQLLHEGTITPASFFEPERVDIDDLLRVHTVEYYEKLETLSLTRREERDIGFPVRRELITRGMHIAQGTIDCAYHAIQDGVALNVAGGTHHAFADHGEGFCVFNDIAIAASHLLAHKKANQILIVDLDVHQGNGTAKIFENEERVFTWSVHGDRNYPLRKMKSDLDTPFRDGVTDEEYLSFIDYTLADLLDSIQPDFVFYLSGVDVLASDKLGRLALTRDGCRHRDFIVFDRCRRANVPVAVSMGGGYSTKMVDIVEAHANTFRVARDLFF